MRVRKILVLIGLLLVVFQIGTFIFLGKANLHVKIIEKLETLISPTDMDCLGLYSKEKISRELQNEIIKKNKAEYKRLEYVDTEDELYSKFKNIRGCSGLIYGSIEEYIFYVKIREFRGTKNYVENWESEFIWILGDWYMIRKTCKGQS